MKKFFAILLFATSVARAQSAQEKINVNLVLLDARVTDRTGSQILGLTKDDFIVKEEGEPQTLEAVDYYTNRRLLSSPEAKAPFAVERVKEERDFIVFFDREQFTQQSGADKLLEARRAVDRFIDEHLQPNDRLAVASYDVRLRLFSDFTSDRTRLHKAISEAGTYSRGITSQSVAPPVPGGILSTIDLKAMINKTSRVQDAVRVLAEATENIPRRKVMIFFSAGMDNDTIYIEPMLRSLSRANVSVYVINLLRDERNDTAEMALTRMTSTTGGKYYSDSVNFLSPLREIEKENNGYYLLSYRTSRDPDKHGFQRVSVSLRNPEFRVQARPGYAY